MLIGGVAQRGQPQGHEQALQQHEERLFGCAGYSLRRHGIAVYGTFMFGYEHDTPDSFAEAVQFAIDERMYITAFNHLTPFPGTPLYTRLQQRAGWCSAPEWLDERYRYNDLPYRPTGMTAQAVTQGCLGARAILQLAQRLQAPLGQPHQRCLHVAQFLAHQCHAPRRHRRAQRLSAG